MRGVACCCVVLLLGSTLGAQEDKDREQLVTIAERISSQQEQLASEISELLRLLGMESALEGVEPIPADDTATTSVRQQTTEAIKEYSKKRYEAAKEAFQAAWEDAPNAAFTNYNLGIAYYKLGKVALAKKMFKAALEIDGNVAAADKVRDFLEGKAHGDEESEESQDLKDVRTKMTNLKKRVDSYLSSKNMGLPKRMSAVAKLLEEMVDTGKEYDVLIQEYYVDIARRFSAFEMYDKAIKLFAAYEKSMRGEVLPDGYHSALLEVQEKQKELETIVEAYIGNEPDKDVGRKLNRDLKELEIFATQIDKFVESPSLEDPDFAKVCQRLKEYRWGDRADRHVVVVSRYQELLYSTLPGTVALDRYQDHQGQKFFKNITLLADRLNDSKSEFVDIDLSINGTMVPYVVMFSYVPKHEAFVIVRLPKRDLT